MVKTNLFFLMWTKSRIQEMWFSFSSTSRAPRQLRKNTEVLWQIHRTCNFLFIREFCATLRKLFKSSKYHCPPLVIHMKSDHHSPDNRDLGFGHWNWGWAPLWSNRALQAPSGHQEMAQTLTSSFLCHIWEGILIFQWSTKNVPCLKEYCRQLNLEEAGTVFSLVLCLKEAIYEPFEVCSRNQRLIPITLATTTLFQISSSRSKESSR